MSVYFRRLCDLLRQLLKWVKDVAEAGGSSYTFHLEACTDSYPHSPKSIITAIHESGMKAGVAISPATPSSAITDEIAESADMLLVMTVVPGKGGQGFMEECLVKVKELRARFPDKNIEVDGGVGPKTIHSCADAGMLLFKHTGRLGTDTSMNRFQCHRGGDGRVCSC